MNKIMNENKKQINEAAKKLGERGGLTTLKLYGKEHFIAMRKKSKGRKKLSTDEAIDKR